MKTKIFSLLGIVLTIGSLCGSNLVWAKAKKAATQPEAASSTAMPTAEEGNLAYLKGRQMALDGKYEEAIPLLEKALKADPGSPQVNHQLGDAYLHLGNYEKAEETTKLAVEKDPSNVEYRTTLGGIYASLKKYPEAKEQYAKILELDQQNQRATLLLGLLEAESGNSEAGVKVLSKAIDENHDNYMALFYRAKIYLEMEKIEEAKGDLERCLALRPAFVEAGTALGLIQEKLGDVDGAIKSYSQIQGNGRFKKRLAQLLLEKNEFDRALEELIEYEKSEPDDYTARVKIGLIYLETKKYSQAIDRFQMILKEQPQSDNVRFYLAAAFEELKQYDTALSHFKRITKESDFFKESMIHIALIYRETHRMKEGVEFGKQLVAKNPTVVEFYDLYASFFEAKKDYKKAAGVIASGLKQFPNDEKLLYFQGALEDKMGERDKGIATMRKILVVNPNNPHALNFLGYTLAEMNQNLDEAEAFVAKAITLRPGDGYIEDSMGWILYRRGKYDEAIVHLEKAAALQPNEAIILEHLGDAYSKKNETAKAADYYKKAVVILTDKKDQETAKKVESKLATLAKEIRNPTNETSN